ncbi:glycosyltransferase [Salipaludibacillus sp. HK11]|uniref:glycosyltransferase n=1 Tax=Salipaludibacillus sp. HK11 TaxID=3394320 RepID=UPI0039FD66C0
MDVSVITCTNREHFQNNIFENFLRQTVESKELIIVLNNDKMDVDIWKKKADEYSNISVMKLPESTSLGACLNEGVKRTQFDYIAKFDDDDFYAKYYLEEALGGFEKSNADIVGKRTVYTFFESKQLLGVHRPFFENQSVNNVRGATLIFRKKIIQLVPFPSINKGEDGSFLWRCVRKGYKIYSTSKSNFVCVRRANVATHTERNQLLIKGCRDLIHTDDYKNIATVRAK